MAHGVPLAASTGGDTCGAARAFFLDVGISSTHHIVRLWHLHECLVEMPRAAAPVSVPIQLPADDRAVVIEASHSTGGEERQARYSLDPNAVIAAAFKAAGLAAPEIPAAPPGAQPAVATGPIIAAALKAAGLMRT